MTAYTRPSIETLDAAQLLESLGPVQGYGASGGGGTNFGGDGQAGWNDFPPSTLRKR
ncbi:MAG TPA: hypothetical protein VJS92_12920 [Candidatus Polarisedimenticolaceae bacterium]|nr:hypothetical protein [Candidatus Polarisedimenticolaceae bacterium]